MTAREPVLRWCGEEAAAEAVQAAALRLAERTIDRCFAGDITIQEAEKTLDSLRIRGEFHFTTSVFSGRLHMRGRTTGSPTRFIGFDYERQGYLERSI